VNSELPELAEFTVTAAPDAFRLPVRLFCDPTVTVPNASVLGVTVSAPVLVPVPVSFTDTFATVDAIAILPAALPAAVGANLVVNVTLCPLFRVSGRVKPDIVKPAPVTVAFVNLTLDPPLLVNVAKLLALLPTGTEPKATVDGFGVSPPVDIPVPVRRIMSPLLDPLFSIRTFPLTVVVEVGSNTIETEVLLPAASVNGSPGLATRKPGALLL
jgi:hypothetical protein